MRILLLGKNGQVGWELQRSLVTLGQVIAIDSKQSDLCGDLTNLSGIKETLAIVKPDIVVNAAAYTAVDKAESEPELTKIINHKAIELLAKETAKTSTLLVHYSTDYVFDGSGHHFRNENDITNPLNIYGRTKRDGELAIVQNNPNHLIFRTSWVISSRGHNFVKTILRLAKEKEELSIVDDQYGAPTSAELIADNTSLAIRTHIYRDSLPGIYHLVARGKTTWVDFASEILLIAKKHGFESKVRKINGIPTQFYSTPARRPLNSRLNNNKFQDAFNSNLPDWSVGLERIICEIIGAY
ncbi:dTDP-4-dehydrorhamnose reductase [Atlantibacter hermannii]|uniref:dTDP-4-dehydrorhamnose reductase n=1 Tax=Atlantibacter hermannii TaxID=565 RepID=UPI00254AFFFC|nr:dTDP-4-dehydrorhamnose reductase [Atlantibacter hermannii]